MTNILDEQTNSKSNRAHFQRDREVWVLDVLGHPKLSPTAKNIGVAISIHMNGEFRQAWPSQKRLAKMCSVSKRTAERATKELEAVGLIHVSRKANCANRYEMRKVSARTDAGDGRVPTAMTVGTDSHVGGVPTAMSPEPLDITSERTSNIEPLMEEAPPSSSFGNSDVVAKEERKGSGERERASRTESKPMFTDYLAQQIQRKYFQ